ncbi:hypothetical protein JZO70_15855 [Enterococcus sp. 669A]|uniref:PTS EIIB type-3 domain-containing protein n=1 Tax=Candidatus Enterococcus moelleringii TaxID=2815325 RepID=A0ABS3LG06_9ENTE|nr:hypothetical protein [Enterococcus sp. 669A]MBO1307651.1 hypothetical protein [Enterococcus sp. 669A]
MKKAVWIYSINAHGNASAFVGGLGFGLGAKKYQEQLKADLLPEIDLQFISYDIASNEVPEADLIIYTHLSEKYLNDGITKKGISLPFQDVYMGNMKDIKEAITSYFANNK